MFKDIDPMDGRIQPAAPIRSGQERGGFGNQKRDGGFGGSFGENRPSWMKPDGTLRTGREGPWEILLREAESGAKLPQSVLELAEREARIDRAAWQAGVDTVSSAAPVIAKQDQWKVKTDIERRELERGALGAADFQTARRAGMQMGRPNENPLLQSMTELGWGVGSDKAHRAVKTLNDPGYARMHSRGNKQYAMENLKYLKPEERAVIEYYARKGEYGRIEEYLKTIDRALNERQRQRDGPAQVKWAKEHPLLGAGANLLYSFTTPAAYLENKRQRRRNAIIGEDVPTDINSDAFFGVHMVRDTERGVSSAAREAAEESTGSSLLGSLAAGGARLGLGAGRFVSKLPLGLEAAALFAGMEQAGETTTSVLERGGTPEQEEVLAGVTGGVEAALSLLPLDKLFGLAKRNPATAREAAELVVECIGLASGEAVLSQAAEQLADTLIMGEQSEYNTLVRELEESGYSRSEAQARALLEYWLHQPGQAGLQGALSGGVGALTSLTLGRLFGENRAPAGEEGWTEAIEAGWADEDGPGAGRMGEPESVDISGKSGIIIDKSARGIREIFSLSEMTPDEAMKIAQEYRERAPIKIPESATIKPTSKIGYEQISYKWRDGSYKYEVRWHTRTPGAPINQGNTWVIERITPGSGGILPKSEILVGSQWVSRFEWQGAIKAYQNGTATQYQLKLLEQGHWKE